VTLSSLSPVLETVSEAHRLRLDPISTPERLLLGPGPSNAHPTVLQALSRPPLGHLDPLYLELMNEVQEMLRYAWQTENRITIPVSGTGSAAMEATIANSIEAGESVVVGVIGYFGQRLVDMCGRYGADLHVIEAPWGEALSLEAIAQALEQHKPKVLALVHAETSTGVCQPLEGVGDLCREHNCLLLLDTVTSLGAVPLKLDELKVDLAYSCSQKGLSCPPGLGPLTMGPRAEEKLDRRQSKVPNWYLDMSGLKSYWGTDRTYHHTAPVNMNFGLREALRLLEVAPLTREALKEEVAPDSTICMSMTAAYAGDQTSKCVRFGTTKHGQRGRPVVECVRFKRSDLRKVLAVRKYAQTLFSPHYDVSRKGRALAVLKITLSACALRPSNSKSINDLMRMMADGADGADGKKKCKRG
jgi:alanine-glyoxylate transaminase/serine-glyoxylate transaminase/serine-pyruvate transaminase